MGSAALLFASVELISAQSLTGSSSAPISPSATTNAPPHVTPAPTNAAPSAAVAPKALPVNADAANESAVLSDKDFVIGGISYAKVLYIDGSVWIRPPDKSGFHLLTEDEPIPVQSVLATGPNATLDFATGPGMAIRMVPATALIVDELPIPSSVKPSSDVPETSQVVLKKGTVFSALGREDGQPIDYKVRTPQGVAGARGTMFSTSVTDGQAEVSMLHGTVNFETPDHQKSQIIAGQSQQISTSSSGKYLFGQRRALNPTKSNAFFNHASGLLEHASGYGIVRRNLGPDMVKTLREQGYSLSPEMRQRFQNAAAIRYKNRPGFNHTHEAQPNGAGVKPNASAKPNATATSPNATSEADARRAKLKEREQEKQKAQADRHPGVNGADRKENGPNGGN